MSQSTEDLHKDSLDSKDFIRLEDGPPSTLADGDSIRVGGTDKPLTVEEVHARPWKYIGYPKFSNWMASEAELFTLRRFDYLHVRVILHLQCELTMLEKHLQILDDERSHRCAPDFNNGTLLWDCPERYALLQEIYEKLKEYNRLLLDHAALKELPNPSSSDIENVEGWFKAHESAIDESESSFIKHKDDLTSLVVRPKTPLRRAIEKFEASRWSRLFQRAPKRLDTQKAQVSSFEYGPSLIRYQSNERVDANETILMSMVGFTMLIAPLWILPYAESPTGQLGIVTGFTALFLGLVQSVAKPFEGLLATGAYSAVLMLFTQVGNWSHG